jgi:hypothetical protein
MKIIIDKGLMMTIIPSLMIICTSIQPNGLQGKLWKGNLYVLFTSLSHIRGAYGGTHTIESLTYPIRRGQSIAGTVSALSPAAQALPCPPINFTAPTVTPWIRPTPCPALDTTPQLTNRSSKAGNGAALARAVHP